MPDPTDYYIIKDLDLWRRLKTEKTELVHIQISECPQLVFEVKTSTKEDGARQSFALAHIIPTLHRIRSYIQSNNIDYKPTGMIEYIFNLQVSPDEMCAPTMMKYRIPATKEIAQKVSGRLFNSDNRLEKTLDDDLIIYYYMSVVISIDHPIFNGVIQRFTSGLSEEHFCLSTSVGSDNANTLVEVPLRPNEVNFEIMHQYAEILYFFSLVMVPEEPEMLCEQVQKFTLNLSRKLGVMVTNREQTICRGTAWRLIRLFFESRPAFRDEIVRAVIEPPPCDRKLNFGECLVLNELRQLWRWYRLKDFHACYESATSQGTKAHLLLEIVQESEAVIQLYHTLWQTTSSDRCIPYAGFFASDEFLSAFDVSRYPRLFYVTKWRTRNDSEKNRRDWTKMVASLPLDFPRLDLDQNVDIPCPSEEDQPTGRFCII